MSFLPWAFTVFLLTVFSGDFLSIANARPNVFLAFVVAASFKRQSFYSLLPSFIFLLITSYVLSPPDGRGDFICLLGFCFALPVIAKLLPISNQSEFLVYSSAAFMGLICFSFVWAKFMGKSALLPDLGILLLSMIYTVCLSTAFFIILPGKRLRK